MEKGTQTPHSSGALAGGAPRFSRLSLSAVLCSTASIFYGINGMQKNLLYKIFLQKTFGSLSIPTLGGEASCSRDRPHDAVVWSRWKRRLYPTLI